MADDERKFPNLSAAHADRNFKEMNPRKGSRKIRNSSSSRLKRKSRTCLTPNQFEFLENSFNADPWPSTAQKVFISSKINKSFPFVKIWYQNRRAKLRKDLRNDNTLSRIAEDSSEEQLIISSQETCHSGRANVNHENELQRPTVECNELMVTVNSTSEYPTVSGVLDLSKKHTQSHYEQAQVQQDSPSLHAPRNSTCTLYQSIIDMIAVEEGVFSNTGRWNQAVNSSLYGISLRGNKRLVYRKHKGLDIVQD